MTNIGPGEILLLALVALVLFGPKRLPEIGRSLGTAMREFRHSIAGEQPANEQPALPSSERPPASDADEAQEPGAPTR